MKVLGISGSLRDNSANTQVLNILSSMLPDHFIFTMFDQLHLIPPFSPGEEESEAVKNFKTALQSADGVIICTPEYAFGVPGVLKNALDWTVSTGEFNEKPVSAISASPLNSGGDKALASLLLTLTALGTRKNAGSSLSIPNIKSKLSPIGVVEDADLLSRLTTLAENLVQIINKSV